MVRPLKKPSLAIGGVRQSKETSLKIQIKLDDLARLAEHSNNFVRFKEGAPID